MPSTKSTNRNDQVGAINKVPTDSDHDATSGGGNGNKLSYSEALNDGQQKQASIQQQQDDGQHERPAGQQRILQPRTVDDDGGWETVPKLSRRDQKRCTVKKQSDALNAPPRRYEIVVFNVTRDHDVDSVKSYITSDVLNIKTLPTNSEFNDCLMFKFDVHYKDRETVLDSNFWSENVGCREFYKRSKFENRVVDQLNRNG